MGIGLFECVFDEFPFIFLYDLWLIVVVFDEVVDFFFERVEEYCVLVDMLEEVLAGGFFVLVELDVSIFIVEVEKRVKGVVVVCLCRGWHVDPFLVSVFLS